ncbi:hypothetical protein FACS1894202_10080 [Clostridia bacterium]|nr:hypothetical protein FACS1894202_10080 [Clostridia bacterium]
MKKISIICYLLSVICYLSFACSPQANDGPTLYRIAEPLEKTTLPFGDYSFKSLANRALPDGIACEAAELNGATLTLTLSEAYLTLAGLQKTLADACLTLTLTELPDVDAVSINGAVFTARDFLLSEQLSETPTAEFELYRIDTAAQRLISVRKRFVLREGELIEQCLYDELLSSGDSDRQVSIIPEHTKLLASEISGGVLTLTLSSEFITAASAEDWMRSLTLRGIVYAFTALEYVDGVTLLVDGLPLSGYGDMPAVLTRDQFV